MCKLFLNIQIVLILMIFTLAGCYGQYEAERDYWLATRQYSRFLKNIDTAKESDYQRLIVDFRKIIINYPAWPKSAQAQLIIADLYSIQNKTDKAINEYKKAIEDYPTALAPCSKALFAIGLIYQRDGDWPEAEKYFRKIMKDYPETEVGLHIPLYLARYYKSRNQLEEAEVAYSQAIEKYKTYIDENPNSIKTVLILDHIINCFGDGNKWEEALVFLRSSIKKHPQSPLVLKALFVIGKINEDELHNTQEAIRVYKEMIERFPESPLSKAVKEHLDQMKPKLME